MLHSVEIIVPVLNEEITLASSIAKLHLFLSTEKSPYRWGILIVDNGSTDRTPSVMQKMTQDYENVRCLKLEKRGRGRALRNGWLESDADILCYMDVDLSTELAALPKLIKAVSINHYDIAIASRIIKGARVINRSLHREFISRIYSRIVRGMFFTHIRDYQCGFKVINRQAARTLTPLVQDTEWFFE